jgi:hypothetical protein
MQNIIKEKMGFKNNLIWLIKKSITFVK